MKQRILLLGAALGLFFSLVGCANQAASRTTLKIAVLPILDGLPLYVAQQEGLFARENLTVELIPALAGNFQVPQFVSAGVPSEKQFADALAWAREKGYVAKDIAYADCVNASFLPK